MTARILVVLTIHAVLVGWSLTVLRPTSLSGKTDRLFATLVRAQQAVRFGDATQVDSVYKDLLTLDGQRIVPTEVYVGLNRLSDPLQSQPTAAERFELYRQIDSEARKCFTRVAEQARTDGEKVRFTLGMIMVLAVCDCVALVWLVRRKAALEYHNDLQRQVLEEKQAQTRENDEKKEAESARIAQIVAESEGLKRQLVQERLRSGQDDLTKCYRRAPGFHQLAHVVHQYLGRAPVGFVMTDLDFFKAVNSVHGQRVGDKVIKAFADILLGNQHRFNHEDFVIRIGGDEFVLVFPGSYPLQVEQVLTDILRQVRTADLKFPLPTGAVAEIHSSFPDACSITATFGFCDLAEMTLFDTTLAQIQGLPPPGLVQETESEADRERRDEILQLFEDEICGFISEQRVNVAKAQGRNRVVGPPHIERLDAELRLKFNQLRRAG